MHDLLETEKPGGETVFNDSLARHTSFGTGGPAECLVFLAGDEPLARLLPLLNDREIPWRFLGGGNNVLVANEGVPGVTFRLPARPVRALPGGRLRAGGGTPLPLLLEAAAEAGLGGLEFAAGIPGTVGGALTMNAGTAEENVGSLVDRVAARDATGARFEFPGAEGGFGYRRSRFPENREIVVEADFALIPADGRAVREKMSRVRTERSKHFPRGRSAGCFFKNPPGNSAGRLIEAAGLKGKRLGEAAVSRKHANFIVTTGHDSEEIRNLGRLVRQEVLMRFGVRLEPEVHFWGWKKVF